MAQSPVLSIKDMFGSWFYWRHCLYSDHTLIPLYGTNFTVCTVAPFVHTVILLIALYFPFACTLVSLWPHSGSPVCTAVIAVPFWLLYFHSVHIVVLLSSHCSFLLTTLLFHSFCSSFVHTVVSSKPTVISLKPFSLRVVRPYKVIMLIDIF